MNIKEASRSKYLLYVETEYDNWLCQGNPFSSRDNPVMICLTDNDFYTAGYLCTKSEVRKIRYATEEEYEFFIKQQPSLINKLKLFKGIPKIKLYLL